MQSKLDYYASNSQLAVANLSAFDKRNSKDHECDKYEQRKKFREFV